MAYTQEEIDNGTAMDNYLTALRNNRTPKKRIFKGGRNFREAYYWLFDEKGKVIVGTDDFSRTPINNTTKYDSTYTANPRLNSSVSASKRPRKQMTEGFTRGQS
jgi:hypothetical protein